MKDLYKILGVESNASEADIKKAYRALARENHPDATGGDAKRTERFKEISDAYAIIGDTKKRSEYDRLRHAPVGADGMPQGFDADSFASVFGDFNMGQGRSPFAAGGGFRGGQGADLNDLFANLFGQGSGRNPWQQRGAAAPRGQDMSARVEIPFAEAAIGTKRKVRGGNGNPIEVAIPPGVETGGRLRIARQGGAAPGTKGHPGDLYLEITVTPHPYLQREGDDVLLDVPITIAEAMVGARVHVPTLDGLVWVNVPPGSSSGRKLRLKGKGIANSDGGRGDQYCRVHVVVPAVDESDEESRRLLTELSQRVVNTNIRGWENE